jgi:hypothetical protein
MLRQLGEEAGGECVGRMKRRDIREFILLSLDHGCAIGSIISRTVCKLNVEATFRSSCLIAIRNWNTIESLEIRGSEERHQSQTRSPCVRGTPTRSFFRLTYKNRRDRKSQNSRVYKL